MAYFVRIRKGDQILPDAVEFPDEHSAREEAVAAAREILAAQIIAAQDNIPDSLIVTDGGDREVASISLRDVLPKGLRGQ